MARSLGIRLGQRSFEIVVLNGNSKKAKLDQHILGSIPFDSDDPVGDGAAAIRKAIEKENLPTESVGLVVETGLAAFRSVRLPFSDPAKIEDVIKFEVESQLPQWNIEDVIVDFLVTSGNEVESNLIVTAIPKADLAQQIAICEGAGLEPMEAEFECSALVNAASYAGLLDAESACVLVSFSDSSTSLILVDGGEVKSIRSIHLGAFAPSTTTEGDEDAEGDGESDGEEPQSEEADAKHLEEVTKRLRRELLRTISTAETINEIEAVYVAGYDLPGFVGENIEGVLIEALAVLPDAEDDEVEDPARLYVAWGAALRELGGGVLKPSLRRENLRFLGTFERLELPLAVLALLLVTLLSVRVIITQKGINQSQQNLAVWLEASNNYMLGTPKAGRAGNLGIKPPESIRDYALNAQKGEVLQTDRFAQLQQIESLLQKEIIGLQRDLGQDVEIAQPMSSLEGLTLVLGVLSDLKDSVGRFTIRSMESNYVSGKGTKDDTVRVKLNLTFRGATTIEASDRYYSFLNTVGETPWFVEDKRVKESTLETADGIYVDGLTIIVDVSKSERTQS